MQQMMISLWIINKISALILWWLYSIISMVFMSVPTPPGWTLSVWTSALWEYVFLLLNNAYKYLVIEVIERVPVYKYLGFFLEENLSFKHHTECLIGELEVKLGFFFRNNNKVSLLMQEKATFLSILDYGDILYMHANLSSLKMLDPV